MHDLAVSEQDWSAVERIPVEVPIIEDCTPLKLADIDRKLAELSDRLGLEVR